MKGYSLQIEGSSQPETSLAADSGAQKFINTGTSALSTAIVWFARIAAHT
jgi:hypothetical protein